MGKLGKGLVAVVALAAAAWAGGWFFVKGKIPQALAQQTAALKAQGLDVTHGPVTVTGFPFKHNARVENVVVSAEREQFGQKTRAVATIPWIEGSWAMFSPSKGQLTGAAETSKVEATIGERKLSGDLKLVNLRGALDGSNPAAAAYDLAVDSANLALTGAASDPANHVPGLRGVSTQVGAITLKGTSGGTAAGFEATLANYLSTLDSEIPNPDPFAENPGALVAAKTVVQLPSLTAKGSREGQNRRGEALLPPEATVRVKVGEAPETVIPLKTTNGRVTFAETPARVDFTFAGDALSYAMTQSDALMTIASDAAYGKFDFKGYADKASFAEFDPAKFEGGGFPDVSKINFRVEYTAADSRTIMKITPKAPPADDPFAGSMPPIPAMDFDVKSGPNEGVIALEKGAFDFYGVSKANVFKFSGPAEVEGDIGEFVVKFQGPLTKADAPQPFVFDYDFKQVNLSEGAWDLIDRTGALDRQINRLRVAFSGDLQLNASLGDQEAAAREGKPPFLPTALKIDDVTVDALGLVAKATGQAAFNPEDLSAPPTGEGLVTLKGWQPFLNSLVDAGLAPPDALAMAEGMIGMLGEENEAGETAFRIAAGPDGVLTVNDNPMGELPGFGAGLGVPGPGFDGQPGEEWPFEEEFPDEEFQLEQEFDGLEESPLAPPAPQEAAPAQEAPPAEEGVIEQLQQGVEGGVQQLEEGAQQLQQNLEDGAGRLQDDVEGGAQQLHQNLQQGLERLEQGVEGGAQQLQDGLQDNLEGLQDGVREMQEGLPNLDQLQQGAEETLQQIEQGVEGGVQRLEEGVQQGLERLEQELTPAAPAAPEEVPVIPLPEETPAVPAIPAVPVPAVPADRKSVV